MKLISKFYKNIGKLWMLVCFIPTLLMAQDFQGKVYYSSKFELNEKTKKGISDPQVSSDRREMRMKILKKAYEKDFVLSFTTEKSLFKEEKQVATGANTSTYMIWHDAIFKNLKANVFKQEHELFGKRFLVDDELPKHNWKLVNETKTIGKYKAHKAILQFEAPEITSTKKNESAISSFLNSQKEQQLEVWYTTEIPVSTGPFDLWGLPGLILEVHRNVHNRGRQVLNCSKIELNTGNPLEIKEPKKGKPIGKIAYEILEQERKDEYNQQYKSRRN